MYVHYIPNKLQLSSNACIGHIPTALPHSAPKFPFLALFPRLLFMRVLSLCPLFFMAWLNSLPLTTLKPYNYATNRLHTKDCPRPRCSMPPTLQPSPATCPTLPQLQLFKAQLSHSPSGSDVLPGLFSPAVPFSLRLRCPTRAFQPVMPVRSWWSSMRPAPLSHRPTPGPSLPHPACTAFTRIYKLYNVHSDAGSGKPQLDT